MTRLKYIFSCIAMLMMLKSTAQNATQSTPHENATLKIGDRLPDFTIGKILNTANGSVNTKQKTSSFDDQLLIIDFWATSCSGCVAALPKMEALQKQFGNRVKILPVTFEPAALITGFWKKNRYTKTLTLPTVVEDKLFKSYFPHQAIPHEVWVYKGEVIGITDASYIDAYNIEQVLSGKVPNWPVKNDYYIYDAVQQPLFAPDEKQVDVSSVYTYAAISDYKEKDGASAAGVFGNAGSVRDSVKKTIRTWFVNQAIFSTYIINWNAVVNMGKLVKPSFSLDPNQVVWEVKDPSRYMHTSSSTPDLKTRYRGDWLRNHAICFESVKRDTGQTNKDISKGIIQDLDRLLGLKVRWEKRKEKVLVLVKTKGKKPAKSVDVSSVIYEMNQQTKNPYVFDETGVNGQIAGKQGTLVKLHVSSWTDITAIKKELLPYGLELKEEERLVDKFVFTELNGGLL